MGEINLTNRVKKKHPEDMTRTELIERLGWASRTFTKRFPKFLDFYNIDKTFLKYEIYEKPEKRLERLLGATKKQREEDLQKICIDHRYKDLLFILLKAFEIHPLYRDNYDETEEVALERAISYNEKLINLVDTLPDNLKYTTMAHPTYCRTVKQLPVMKKMSKKLHQFLAASVLAPKQVRLQVWEEMFDFVDYMIFRIYDLTVKYRQEQTELLQKEKTEAKKKTILRKTNPNQVYHEILIDVFDDSAKNAVKADDDLPCDTLDGYLALLLKGYVIAVELVEGNPEIRSKVEEDIQLAYQIAAVGYDAIAKEIGVNADVVQEAELEMWQLEVAEYAEQAKTTFTSNVSLKESMKKVWKEFKPTAECKFERKHYKEFQDFCDDVEKASSNGDYILENIIKDKILEVFRDKP